MKHFFTAILLCIASITYADTYNYKDMEPLKLEVPEMKAELGTVNNEEFDRSALSLTAPAPKWTSRSSSHAPILIPRHISSWTT